MKLYAVVRTDDEEFTKLVVHVERDFIKAQKALAYQVARRLHKQMLTPDEPWRYNYYCAIIEYNDKLDKKLNMVQNANSILRWHNLTEVNTIEKA